MKPHKFMIASPGLRWIAAVGLALGTLTANAAEAPDLDGDGIPNIVDPDIDNDGIPNALDDNVDGGIARTGPFAGQYIGDHINNDNPAEKDIDDDGQADDSLGETDIDGDGKTDDNPSEDDIDGDRRKDDDASEMDIDGDGRLDDNPSEDDIDGDSLDDDDFMEDDIDGDGIDDSNDDDIDGDNRGNSGDLDDDTDGDGVRNADDDDSDGDGVGNRDDDDDDNDGDTDEDDLDHHADDDELAVEVYLTPTAAAPSGSRSRVEVQRMATGKIELDVDARDLAAGSYDVVVDGQVLGQLVMILDDDRTEGEVEFETNANDEDEIELPFDPIGLPIELVRAGVTYYSGTVPTPADAPGGGDDNGGDGGDGTDFTAELTRAEGLSPEANAAIQLQFGVFGLTDVEVEVEKVPEGSYDFIVGGTQRGTIVVALEDGETKGRLDYDIVPNDPGELLLDFPVAGESITISQGGSVFFTGTAPTGG